MILWRLPLYGAVVSLKNEYTGKLTNEANNGNLTNEANNGKLTNEANNGKLTNEANNGKLTNEANNGKLTNETNNEKLVLKPEQQDQEVIFSNQFHSLKHPQASFHKLVVEKVKS